MKVKKRTLRIGAIALIVIIALVFFFKMRGTAYEATDTPKAILGNPDAEFVIQEFFDLQCPGCRQAHPILKAIVQEHGDKIRFEMYHFPLLFHRMAKPAALAAECANDQGKFHEFVDTVYARQAEISRQLMYTIAQDLALDKNQFKACFDTAAKTDVINADIKYGSTLNVHGTPSVFVNGEFVESWSYETLDTMIKEFYS